MSYRSFQKTGAAVREAAADVAELNNLDSSSNLLPADTALRHHEGNGSSPPKLVFAPEDFKLEPGVHSHIDRQSPSSAEDVFRCSSCTEAACQVLDAHSVGCSAVKARSTVLINNGPSNISSAVHNYSGVTRCHSGNS